LVNLISEIDEFKGKWGMLQNIAPERLSALRHVATIESVDSSTRIEGVRNRNLDERQSQYAQGAIALPRARQFFRAERKRTFDLVCFEAQITWTSLLTLN
jgi:hypothetical protein